MLQHGRRLLAVLQQLFAVSAIPNPAHSTAVLLMLTLARSKSAWDATVCQSGTQLPDFALTALAMACHGYLVRASSCVSKIIAQQQIDALVAMIWGLLETCFAISPPPPPSAAADAILRTTSDETDDVHIPTPEELNAAAVTAGYTAVVRDQLLPGCCTALLALAQVPGALNKCMASSHAARIVYILRQLVAQDPTLVVSSPPRSGGNSRRNTLSPRESMADAESLVQLLSALSTGMGTSRGSALPAEVLMGGGAQDVGWMDMACKDLGGMVEDVINALGKLFG